MIHRQGGGGKDALRRDASPRHKASSEKRGSGLVVVAGCQLADLDDHLHGLLHHLDGDKLIGAVEVDAASEDVGAGKAAVAELGAVRAATDRLYLRLHTRLLHGLEHEVDDVHIGLDLLLHVVVLVGEGDLEDALAVLLVHLGHAVGEELLALLKLLTVVVADDVGELALLAMALDGQEVVEALVALGGLGDVGGGDQGVELGGQAGSVDHLALGVARMDAHAVDDDLGSGGVEALILQFADVATVHRVGPLAAKLLHVEVVGALADLLVGVEAHADLAVLHLGMVAQPAHGLDDLGDAGLVVGAQQRGAVGDDEVLTLVGEQLGEHLRRGDDARRKLDVAAVVALDDTGLDVGTTGVEGGIVVGDEADGGNGLVGVGGKGGVDVAFLVHLDFLQALLLQLFLEVAGEDELLRVAGYGLGLIDRLGVKLGVVDKSFCYFHKFWMILVFFFAKIRFFYDMARSGRGIF